MHNKNHNAANPFILGSASPRRRELLQQLNLSFEVRTADIDEGVHEDEGPAEYVLRMAMEKARALTSRPGEDPLPVLTADTAVVVDAEILGKPAHREEARCQLKKLSGREHKVLTAVALATSRSIETRLSVSRVRFKPLDEATIDAYWNTGEPADKAGSYGIQGLAAVFIEDISGSYTGIMGLPLYETAQLLETIGYRFPE